MGIKTMYGCQNEPCNKALKNLPTTWGLRRERLSLYPMENCSEKPPHHMGIKTKINSWMSINKAL